MAFPLFTQQMYNALTYKWANTVFALIATIMIPIPFVCGYTTSLSDNSPLIHDFLTDFVQMGSQNPRGEQVRVTGYGEADRMRIFRA